MEEVTNKIRRICARLVDESEESARFERYCSELRAATRELAAKQKLWEKPWESDTQSEARQSYRNRETRSADGFAEELKLIDPRKPATDQKKD